VARVIGAGLGAQDAVAELITAYILLGKRRLFSFISGNCAGTPLRTWELFLAAIRGTTTKAGLTVEAVLHSAKLAAPKRRRSSSGRGSTSGLHRLRS
jgi:hypothetical protein